MCKQPVMCQECGNPVQERRNGGQFCCTGCRMDFNNRRMKRGAQMYDLFRALRRERAEAGRLGVWSQLCRLELGWQEEDEATRPGRRSYVEPARALTHLTDTGALPRGELLCKNYAPGRRATR